MHLMLHAKQKVDGKYHTSQDYLYHRVIKHLTLHGKMPTKTKRTVDYVHTIIVIQPFQTQLSTHGNEQDRSRHQTRSVEDAHRQHNRGGYVSYDSAS